MSHHHTHSTVSGDLRGSPISEVCVCVSVKRGLSYGKKDLLHTQERPTDIPAYLRYAEVSKATYYEAKETYHKAKETYYKAKEAYDKAKETY